MINAVVREAKFKWWPDPSIFFWIAASAGDIPYDKPNGIKTLLANGVSTLFIYHKPTIIDGKRKFKNRLYWLAIFLVISFKT